MAALMIVCGGLGAVLRFLVDHLSARHITRRFPVGTLLVNIAGSFGLGLVVGFFGAHSQLALVLGTGLLGGFTTFSTHIVETLRLGFVERRWVAAAGDLVMTLASCMAAGWLGLYLTIWL